MKQIFLILFLASSSVFADHLDNNQIIQFVGDVSFKYFFMKSSDPKQQLKLFVNGKQSGECFVSASQDDINFGHVYTFYQGRDFDTQIGFVTIWSKKSKLNGHFVGNLTNGHLDITIDNGRKNVKQERLIVLTGKKSATIELMTSFSNGSERSLKCLSYR